MKKSILTFLGVIVTTVAVLASNPENGKLSITVKNVSSTEGVVTVSLFSSEANWLKNGVQKNVKVVNKESVTVEFKDLPSGTYAISVIHDKNSNGDLDSNLFGMPIEAYGFSNDARGMFGPASYEDSKFEIYGDSQIVINIK